MRGFRIKIGDVLYRVVFEKPERGLWGDCDPPTRKNPKIRLHPDLLKPENEQLLSDTANHEFDHAAFWFIREDRVEQVNPQRAKYLHRLGYRRVSDD